MRGGGGGGGEGKKLLRKKGAVVYVSAELPHFLYSNKKLNKRAMMITVDDVLTHVLLPLEKKRETEKTYSDGKKGIMARLDDRKAAKREKKRKRKGVVCNSLY
ncbi:unnamed protein product [Sphagnum jensenii]|uniref:Uncharacterized protein n=1 Tax=Sphagnum jensenii TaxID=128206 RepID=A0ABP1AI55_9BRYO